jgi:putative transcriptional regulator
MRGLLPGVIIARGTDILTGEPPAMTSRALLLVVGILGVLAGSAPVDSAPPVRSLAGELLVATPEMRDPRFARTVIYMMRHDSHGAQGLVINRPLGEVPLARLLERLHMDSTGAAGMVRLHTGGPVEPLNVIVLHTSDYAREGTIAIKDGISVTVDPDILRAIADGKGPRRMLFALGYAGWAPGQLEDELEAGAWIRAGADESILFDPDYDKKWERAQARQRIDL